MTTENVFSLFFYFINYRASKVISKRIISKRELESAVLHEMSKSEVSRTLGSLVLPFNELRLKAYFYCKKTKSLFLYYLLTKSNFNYILKINNFLSLEAVGLEGSIQYLASTQGSTLIASGSNPSLNLTYTETLLFQNLDSEILFLENTIGGENIFFERKMLISLNKRTNRSKTVIDCPESLVNSKLAGSGNFENLGVYKLSEERYLVLRLEEAFIYDLGLNSIPGVVSLAKKKK